MANPFKVIKNLLGAEEQIADFITSGPSGGLSGHVRDRYRHRCNEFANLPGWARALSGVAGGSINRICSPYWDASGVTGPDFEPGYQGGQCPAVYIVFAQDGGTDLNIGGQSPASLQGPLGGVTFTQTLIGTPFSDSTRYRWVFSGPNASVEFTGRSQFVTNPSFRIAGREDGQPDDCGDQPSQPKIGPNPPPNPGPLPGPEPTDNPDPNNPIPDLPIPPFIDPIFGPQPVVGPNDPGSGEPVAPQPSGDGIPGEDDAVGDGLDPIEGGDDGTEVDFGEPPLGKIWVGCLVEFSAGTNYGGIPGTSPENTVYPTTIGNVSLRYAQGRGGSQQVRSRWVEATRSSTSLVVEGAFIQARLGVTAVVYPLSATVCKEPSCPLE